MLRPEMGGAGGPTAGWAEVWENRRVPADAPSVLAGLMAADGLDTALGSPDERAWTAFVRQVASRLGVRTGDRVLEVGCGAGAFLYELDAMEAKVAGVDRSAGLVEIARQALPGGAFTVSDADAFDVGTEAEFVVSCGVFMYFRSLRYAERVIRRMVRVATRGVAILDIPDAALASQALRARHAAAGGRANYERRYAGLSHLAYERTWVERALRRSGLASVSTTSQEIDGYANGRYRFNAWGMVSSRPASGRQ